MQSPPDSKREAIIELAARLFMEKGYHTTSVRDLAQAAGISQATLYYYIGSKMDLLVAIHNSFIDDLLARLSRVVQSELPPARKLREFIAVEMTSVEQNRTRVAAFMRERHALAPEVRAQIQIKRDQVDAILEQILKEGIAAGVFRPLPVKSVRLALLGMVNWPVEWFNPDGPIPSAQFAADFSDFVLRGILAEERTEEAAPALEAHSPS